LSPSIFFVATSEEKKEAIVWLQAEMPLNLQLETLKNK
jgi:hypothetical protein